MTYILKAIGKSTNVPYHFFECDNESDLSTIDVSRAPMGSRCYVINAGEIYALNSLKQWRIVPQSSGSSGGSGTPDGGNIIYDGGEEVNGYSL